jgi:hypothetical protein
MAELISTENINERFETGKKLANSNCQIQKSSAIIV